MAINILIVNEDLTTVTSDAGYIESDDNFYYNVRKIATDLGLAFVPTIDPYGRTVINNLQLTPLLNEIKILRNHPEANQETLDTLEKAINATEFSPHTYILFVGD